MSSKPKCIIVIHVSTEDGYSPAMDDIVKRIRALV